MPNDIQVQNDIQTQDPGGLNEDFYFIWTCLSIIHALSQRAHVTLRQFVILSERYISS